jgi:hypothetical protein
MRRMTWRAIYARPWSTNLFGGRGGGRSTDVMQEELIRVCQPVEIGAAVAPVGLRTH